MVVPPEPAALMAKQNLGRMSGEGAPGRPCSTLVKGLRAVLVSTSTKIAFFNETKKQRYGNAFRALQDIAIEDEGGSKGNPGVRR